MYPRSNEKESSLKKRANKSWNFAFSMEEGDFVICPSPASGYILIGNIVGGYENDFNNHISIAKARTRDDFKHLRRVKWSCSIAKSDPRYNKLPDFRQPAIVKFKSMPEEKLLEIIGEK